MSRPSIIQGRLIIVGLGIEWAGQTTPAARAAIERADTVWFAVASPWAARWLRTLNPRAKAFEYPRDGRPRQQIYRAMVQEIMASLRMGKRVCAVFYGHPGFLVAASHAAIDQARAEGHQALMLPGVSSIDCLFADLGIDPGADGCQIFEATVFLRRPIRWDTTVPLVICQIALVANHLTFDAQDRATHLRGIERLQDKLANAYPARHTVTIYEAATDPSLEPRVVRFELASLANAEVSEIATLFIPPSFVEAASRPPAIDSDQVKAGPDVHSGYQNATKEERT